MLFQLHTNFFPAVNQGFVAFPTISTRSVFFMDFKSFVNTLAISLGLKGFKSFGIFL